MKRYTLCPQCRNPITIGDFVRSWNPFRVKCSHCKTRLQTRPGLRPIFIGFIILLVLTPLVIGILYEGGVISALGALAILIGLPFLMEIAWALIIINVIGLMVRE
jgi:hypothetical protein